MAPRKNKSQTKRNNIKIKSKVNGRKREQKLTKKAETSEKPLNNLKWLNKVVADAPSKKCEALPDWLKNGTYKRKNSSETNTSEYDDYPHPEEEEKSSISEASEECNCQHSKYSENSKGGILKMKVSSTSSLVSKYIKSGMNQVAAFIVESAIRFGEQHGVVVPDKNTPNLYEVTPPDSRFADKCRKIRFKVPEKSASYEDAKKSLWKGYNKNPAKRAQTPLPDWDSSRRTKSSSWESTADSLEEILPILEKLKDGGDIVTSDLDLEKLRRDVDETAEKEKARDWGRLRDRDRERVRGRLRTSDRGKDRLREKLRTLKKRYKSLGTTSDKASDEIEYPLTERSRWKKSRRDSVELGRQRMRAANNRKQEKLTPPPY